MPKFSYSPLQAQRKREKKLVESRQGINASYSELMELIDVIKPLTKKGQSFYAIKANNDFITVSLKTLYNYQNQGYLGLTDVDLPRKARFKKRKLRRLPLVVKKLRINREYKDFKQLPKYLQENAYELDSIEGFKTNTQRVFSFHNRVTMFQIFTLVKDSSSAEIVKVIDMFEFYLGSCNEFKRLIPIMLLDRGSEFDDIEGLERSYFDSNKKRCSVYFCDPNSPFQKGKCENNHEFFRRIVPKKHSDFDKLTNYDMAVITSHINSYVRASLNGKAPLDLASHTFPKEFFEMLGIEKIDKNDVLLKPGLVPHILTN